MVSDHDSPIRSASIRLGLSRDELGRVLGVSGRTVSYWESGRKLPAPGKAGAIRDALKLSEVDMWRVMHHPSPKTAIARREERPW
jgi:transcriptional regulator with XRE-family HTH domain